MIKISASSISRFKQCPGAAYLDSITPDNLKYFAYAEAADFGTRCHAIGEAVLKSGISNKKARRKFIEAEAVKTFPADQVAEIADMVCLYVDTVKKGVQGKNNSGSLLIEEKTRANFDGLDLVFKADALAVNKHGLKFYDLKSGSFDYADAGAFEQMRFSAMVYILANNLPGRVRCSYTVIQPRYWNESRRVVTMTETFTLDGVIEGFTKLSTSVKSREFVTGDKCRFCGSILNCPAIRNTIKEIETMSADTVTIEQMQKYFLMKDAVETFYKAIEQKLTAELTGGAVLDSVELKKTFGNRKWIDEKLVEERLAYLGSKRYTKPELLSVAKLEALAGFENISDLVTRSESFKVVKKEDLFEAVK